MPPPASSSTFTYTRKSRILLLPEMIWAFSCIFRIVWQWYLTMLRAQGWAMRLQPTWPPIPQTPGAIRLLRLLPSRNEQADLRCELFGYNLQESRKGQHPYEALSYVWGGSDDSRTIFINNQRIEITPNLHAALIHLRETNLPRIIWIDALCINQADDTEKASQIQLMREIYASASCVIVWLGAEQDDSDTALEYIRSLGENRDSRNFIEAPDEKLQAVIRLLQRHWFRRIWVLQEVSAARQVLIMCGSIEIDGYAFCSGLRLLNIDLQGSIYSATALIQKAIFRPRHARTSLRSGSHSLAVHSLGELIDRYHTYEASIRHDKLYALLGMSSNDLSTAGLEPNYNVPWGELMQRLVRYLLGSSILVKAWDSREIAVIKCQGYALGRVSSCKPGENDKEHIYVGCRSSLEGSSYEVSLPVSGKTVQEGDIICMIQGARAPSIIRLCRDYFVIVQMTAILKSADSGEKENNMDLEFSHRSKHLLRDIHLIWDWERDPETSKTKELFEAACPEPPWNGFNENSSARSRFYHVALILQDVQDYHDAETRLQDALQIHKRFFENDRIWTLDIIVHLALRYFTTERLSEAMELQWQILQTRKDLQGEEHQDTLGALQHLILTYGKLGYFDGIEHLQVLRELVKRKDYAAEVTERDLVEIAGAEYGAEVMRLVLARRGDEVLITGCVVEAAAANRGHGAKVMKFLLDSRGDSVRITEEVVKTAASNILCGLDVLRVLVDRRRGEIRITDDVIKAAGTSFRPKECLELLFDELGEGIEITQDLMKAAGHIGLKMMEFLLDRRGDNVLVTEDILQAAVQGPVGVEMIRLLFDRGFIELNITEKITKDAVENQKHGLQLICFLLDEKEDEVEITEEIILAALRNTPQGHYIVHHLVLLRSIKFRITLELISAAAQRSSGWLRTAEDEMERVAMLLGFLFEHRTDDFQMTEEIMVQLAPHCGTYKIENLLEHSKEQTEITDEVIIAAASNPHNAHILVEFLLNQGGDSIRITEHMVKAAAENYRNGEQLIRHFLDRNSANIPITEEVIEAAIRNEQQGVRLLELFDEVGHEVQISEEMIKIAIKNKRDGHWILKYWFDRKGDQIKITEAIMESAMSASFSVAWRLLDHMGDELHVTEKMVKLAAKNSPYVLQELFERRGDEIKVPEEVVGAVVKIGEVETMKMLLDMKGEEIKITEGIVKLAAGHSANVFGLLLERRGDEIEITEEVIQAALNHRNEAAIKLLLDRRGSDLGTSEWWLKWWLEKQEWERREYVPLRPRR